MADIDRGAKLEKLQKLYEAFQKKETEVRDLISLLDGQANDSHGFWAGPGANRFRDEWRDFKPQVNKLADSLHDAYKSAKNSHDRIEQATSA
ncbi:WXG100 family type VII secretion target [Streptomyces sp. NPDC051218]|uniref:WXG100 family type VII secretion target n=1 Tax=Streptomyces sp. NPDC051218 TaxID=3365645 RepID=UPI0037BD8F65